MTLHIEPTKATLGAMVTGVDLKQLGNTQWEQIEAAFHEFAVLVFPQQNLSDEAQIAFAKRFGEIEELVANKELIRISNQRPDGSLMEDHEHFMQILRGNEGWHTDSSYMPLAAKASVLQARKVPGQGGQTEWADMRAAYEALDEATKEKIAPLSAYHSITYSQARLGHKAEKNASYGLHENPPPLRPLIKLHPVTERPALYLGRHAFDVTGLSTQESEKLLQDLVDFACQPPRIYTHSWNVGDVVIWDNRCVLHRARPFDHRKARVMHHTRIAGDPQTEYAASS